MIVQMSKKIEAKKSRNRVELPSIDTKPQIQNHYEDLTYSVDTKESIFQTIQNVVKNKETPSHYDTF